MGNERWKVGYSFIHSFQFGQSLSLSLVATVFPPPVPTKLLLASSPSSSPVRCRVVSPHLIASIPQSRPTSALVGCLPAGIINAICHRLADLIKPFLPSTSQFAAFHGHGFVRFVDVGGFANLANLQAKLLFTNSSMNKMPSPPHFPSLFANLLDIDAHLTLKKVVACPVKRPNREEPQEDPLRWKTARGDEWLGRGVF